MWVLQQVRVTGTPIVAAVVVYYFTRRRQYLVASAAILPLKLVIEKGVLKKLVERDRPFESVGAHINVRGPAFEGLSFPSGHTTTIFAISVLLSATGTLFAVVLWYALSNRVADEQREEVVAQP
ncbi:MAG: phosphatase PAP2 family protein [Acidimicrobiia bacterium]|nr:phosphatase PAP2 family protein [Acidimicrobiia bacterium]